MPIAVFCTVWTLTNQSWQMWRMVLLETSGRKLSPLGAVNVADEAPALPCQHTPCRHTPTLMPSLSRGTTLQLAAHAVAAAAAAAPSSCRANKFIGSVLLLLLLLLLAHTVRPHSAAQRICFIRPNVQPALHRCKRPTPCPLGCPVSRRF